MRFNLPHLMSLLSLRSQTKRIPGISSIGIYNTSFTPKNLPFNTYNYCNAPHVNVAHYEPPENVDAALKYVTIVMRHHKRTPDNLYPGENALNPATGWDCSNFIQNNYADHRVPVNHQTDIPSWHPFLSRIWNGSCDSGQLTAAGLDDAIQHGQDLWSVYAGRHGLIQSVNEKDLYIRTSNSDRTYQVTGALLFGMDPEFPRSFQVHTQPSNIDSLVPSYSCPAAKALRHSYQSVPEWTRHLDENKDLSARLDGILGTGGLPSWHSWYDHFFDTFTSRTCHGHPLPCNATGSCVSEVDARRVHEIGDFEYNYIWNAAVGAKRYVQLTFGVMFLELSRNLHALGAGTESYKMRLYVGHDGSMIRLASGLGIGNQAPLKWPALGSEIIMEVWETLESDGVERFVRVLHEGTLVKGMNWIPLSNFTQLLESNIPSDLAQACSL